MDKNFLKVIAYLVMCILFGSVINESAQILFLKNKMDDIKNKIVEKESENQLLNDELVLLENDKTYLSILARKNLGMIKHSEKVYKFDN
tara:strand:- start:282 stop:548 length:267 start_codon:yes stop_codon:yes gene_type:complete